MYDFVNTDQTSGGYVLPSEAMKLNGEYIENLIEGYRTLNVSGREAMSPELNSYETGVRDGSKLKSRRYPSRTIVITYQLIARSNEEFREAYNKLGGILNVENAELIFNDEQDKFFVGTPSMIGQVKPGINSVIGEIEIVCLDPFKYSVVEYEAIPALDESSILLDYNGTYKSYPTLEADFHNETDVAEDGETAGALTGSGDCGFVAFFTENKKIVQLGNPDELDGATAFEKSQTLMNQTFQSNTAWGTTAKALWTVNSGNIAPIDAAQVGNVAMKVASYAVPATPASTSGTLINTTSDAGQPPFNYTVVAKTSGRTETSVKVAISITASLKNNGSWFGNGLGLMASVYIGGAWRNVTMKEKTEYWKGRTGHTVNLSVTVTGLSATTSALTGIKFKVYRTDSGTVSGAVSEKKCNNLAISQYVADVPETYYLAASDYGTSTKKWHGASITRTFPADASGETGAKDFTLTYKQKLCIGNASLAVTQLGGFSANLSTADNKMVAGVRITKHMPGTSGTLVLYVNGINVHQVAIDLSHTNKYFGAGSTSVQTSTIRKVGKTVYFTIGGYSKTFSDDAIANIKATKVTFMFERHATNNGFEFNGLYWAKFVKNNCDTYKDIPNKFSANDVVTADCRNGEIFLNGVHSPELGALGNDWETFCIVPGLNQIGLAFSDWVAEGYEPKFKVRYREVFL